MITYILVTKNRVNIFEIKKPGSVTGQSLRRNRTRKTLEILKLYNAVFKNWGTLQ